MTRRARAMARWCALAVIVVAIGCRDSSAPSAMRAPANLRVEQRNATSLLVDWDSVPGATSYDLYWSTTPGVTPATGTLVANVQPPYLLTGLQPVTSYSITVVARNDTHASAPAAAVSAETQTTLAIVSVSLNAVHSDSFAGLAVVTTGVASISSVTATFDATTIELDSVNGEWNALLPIASLSWGVHPLVITVRDAANAVLTLDTTLVHDAPPVVTILAPSWDAVAFESVHLVAKCVDDRPAPCTSIEAIMTADGSVVASGTSSLDVVLPVPDFGRQGIAVVATDAAGNQGAAFTGVVGETGTNVERVADARGDVIDFDGDRMLNTAPDDPNFLLAIGHVGSGTNDSLLAVQRNRYLELARLIPGGAVAIAIPVEFRQALYELRPGRPVTLLNGRSVPPDILVVKGPYALWNQGNTLYRRDTGVETTTPVATGAGADGDDLLPNGDVFYWTLAQPSEIWRWRSGATTRIAPADGSSRRELVASDSMVAYNLVDSSGAQLAAVIDGGEIVVDSAHWSNLRVPHRDFEAAGRWVAFVRRVSSTLNTIVWRTPSGQLITATTLPGFNTIRGLNDDGTLVFDNGPDQFIVKPSAPDQAMLVSHYMARPLWLGGILYLLEGGSVLRYTGP